MNIVAQLHNYSHGEKEEFAWHYIFVELMNQQID